MHTIFGRFHLDGRHPDRSAFERMPRALAGRELYDGKTWSADSVALGYCLYDGTARNQNAKSPFVSGNDRVLVSSGYINNRPELVKELYGGGAYEDVSESDILLRAYDKWGLDCPAQVTGDIVFAVWDARLQSLLIARSPFAERTVFFRSTPTEFAFAGRPKGLFALPGITREIDEERIADYLITAPPSAGKSFYKGIERLESGCLAIVDRRGHKTRRFWQPDFGNRLTLSRDDEYVEAFRALFSRVVGDHCRSQGGVGIMLSGGLDSSSIAATAAPILQEQGRRLAGFTGAPPEAVDPQVPVGRIADETPQVRALARMYGNIDAHEVRMQPSFYLQGIREYFENFEAPMRSASNRVWVEKLFLQAQEQGIECLLTGGGGNLSISWDGSDLLPQLIQRGAWQQAWREARALQRKRGTGRPTWRSFVAEGLMPVLPNWAWRTLEAVRRRQVSRLSVAEPWQNYSPIHPEFARNQRLKERARDKQHDLNYRHIRADNRRKRYDFLLFMNEMYSEIVGGYHSRYGIEMRSAPFDPRLINFCLSVPDEQCLRDGESRWLIRRAMVGRLPAEILGSRKRGLPGADWLHQLLSVRRELIDELSQLRRSPLACAMIDLDRLDTLAAKLEHVTEKTTDLDRLSASYRTVMEIGVMVGRFLRWVESGE